MSATSSPTAFLNVATGKPAEHTPVWFMRQAGRSLPEYRAVRGEGSILDAIKQPRLAADITLQPVARYGVDAAVLYSDIVVPAHAVGFGIDVAPGTGPVAEKPFRTVADLQRLRPLDPEADTPYVLETVRMLAAELKVPLLAFAGAPFTVGSYLVVGKPSRDHLLEMMKQAGPQIIGLDWRTSITDARRRLGEDTIVQGNLNPELVLGDIATALAGTDAVLADNGGNPGHIFNLGHGVQPPTNPDVLAAIVEHVHNSTKR